MQKWLARFSFSFLIIAAVLAWEGWKRINAQNNVGFAYFVGAGALAALGAAGVRARHRDEL